MSWSLGKHRSCAVVSVLEAVELNVCVPRWRFEKLNPR
jgi:hypothetical protein